MIKKYPFYLKSTVILFGLILFVYALFNLRDILVPLSFALMLSVLLNPVTNRLQRWKIPRIWAIFIALLLAIFLIAAVAYFLSSQIAGFSDELPQMKKKFAQLAGQLQHELNHRFGMNMAKQNQMLTEAETGMKPWIGSTLGTLAGSMAMVFLLPVYTFLFLFYKTLLLNFLYEVFAEENSTQVGAVLQQTKKAIQSYMFGLLIEALIIATLNSVVLLLFGVEYAILLGVIGAVLNVLPYIGGILAIAFPLLIATITKDGFQTQLGILVSYLVIQFVDNHFIVPYIVSSKVRINALISVVIVLLGGAVWGVPGMFLSIPFMGVLKIIFDRVPDLKPWGKLLGDEVPTSHKGQIWGARKRTNNKDTLYGK